MGADIVLGGIVEDSQLRKPSKILDKAPRKRQLVATSSIELKAEPAKDQENLARELLEKNSLLAQKMKENSALRKQVRELTRTLELMVKRGTDAIANKYTEEA